jgi:phosphate transport system substrate-binding protein
MAQVKNKILIFAQIIFLCACLCGCARGDAIDVVTREDGSGTREVFVRALGIKNSRGNVVKDRTTSDAAVTNKMDVMYMSVASDENAIGYISLSSLAPGIKAVSIDGVFPMRETVKDGSYPLARSLNIISRGRSGGICDDFLAFALSTEGQRIASENYIPVNDNPPPYEPKFLSGKISISGSSSVSPLVENLKEAYTNFNKNVTIELQITDSTTGILSVSDDSADLGLSSRALSSAEQNSGLFETPIALDALAVIVNEKNPISNITVGNCAKIFSGEITKWSELPKATE